MIRAYEELSKSWDEVSQKKTTEYTQKCNEAGILPSPKTLSEQINEAVSILKHQQKSTFMSKAMKWIDAFCYQETAIRANRNSDIKMYSNENIEWHTFHHKINKDIKIELNTNFGFGSAAYFLLGVKYKGIAILPYSYIVKYYKAGMADIVRCTRSYQACRDSWCASFDFLSDFINNPIENPESFVKRYIMCEVEEMMEGLEAIAQNPKMYMDRIGDTKADPCVVNVRPMFSDDKKRMVAYPSETPILFKVEKITGALNSLKSLTEISQEVSEVEKHIKRLLELNQALAPEIEYAVKKITSKIDVHTLQKDSLVSQITILTNKLNPFEEEIQNQRKVLPANQYFSISDYENTHPQYKKLKDQKNDLTSQLYKVNRIISDLSNFLGLLNSSLQKVNEIKVVSKAA